MEIKVHKEIKHKPFCAKIIAINNATPWNVRCDCQKKKRHFCRLSYRKIYHQPDCKGFPAFSLYLTGDSLTGRCSCIPK